MTFYTDDLEDAAAEAHAFGALQLRHAFDN